MSVKGADFDSELVEKVCEQVRERLSDGRAELCEAFVRQLYRLVHARDLADRDPHDLMGAALAEWKLVEGREPGEIKLRVYNPDPEEDGWRSPHTVVELVMDDMPFIVDSVTMELARAGYGIDLAIHPVMHIRRDDDGQACEILDRDDDAEGVGAEAILHLEIEREPDDDVHEELHERIEAVLHQVKAAVSDWHEMRDRAVQLSRELEELPEDHGRGGEDTSGEVDEEENEQDETAADPATASRFLKWLADDHFTFLGYREYRLLEEDGETLLEPDGDSGLGILRDAPARRTTLGEPASRLAHISAPLIVTKANSHSRVHRPAYLDYIGVKRFDEDGQVVGERRILGLYTTAAYRESAREIPLLADKVNRILERSGFPEDSHDGKALLDVLESYPRDSLFQATVGELYDIGMGVLSVGERQRVRLFVRRDSLNRFADCLVCVPRDRFNTTARERIASILRDEFGATEVDWTLQLSESVLARVHYVVRCPEGVPTEVDVQELEGKLAEATRAWGDALREALSDELGEDDAARILKRYGSAFPAAYRDERSPRTAVADIGHIEELAERSEPVIVLYRPEGEDGEIIRCKLFSAGGISLSDVLPTFEHMGAKVVDERPYKIRPEGRDELWLYDFGLRCITEDLDDVRELFEDAFMGVWRGELEDDGLGALVLRAGLSGRQVTVIRAIARYLRQGGISYSDAYMERTLIAHPEITSDLVKLFAARLDPQQHDEDDERAGEKADGQDEEARGEQARDRNTDGREKDGDRDADGRAKGDEDRDGDDADTEDRDDDADTEDRDEDDGEGDSHAEDYDDDEDDEAGAGDEADGAQSLAEKIEHAIDDIESLDEDRILRSFLSVVKAILRTNFFASRRPDSVRACVSFKLDAEAIPVLPMPRPEFEIFVYSPQVEGVHLRGGKVARGGLRWSDRPEDFRTEILGLMKAQMVKNALIVPVGSKGGFVVKQPPKDDPDALNEEAIACYRTFLSGLLDVTDNIEDGDVVPPEGVVRYDEDDPYLVVAADKGTASFSDCANELAKEYGFWLGDGFASGGSHGYDHKEMGITARGAWESVKRHFRELGTDIDEEDFTVVGIGDMSGDVFGNGMLLSRHIKLVAAFNHMHVFLDPDPDPEKSFKERKRLFDEGRSSWEDYDEDAISEGGGVYERTEKSVKLSKQVREALSIDAEKLSPNELIQELLRAPVDLLWNGGVGTYVKASAESHSDAGDKAGDSVRVDADELQVKVVGEGGNLGFTQRGRIEYALAGGRIYTDAIDNVAGVNTSDHEVNIKILLDAVRRAGDLDEDGRNELLKEMTDSVSERVIYASYTQSQALSLSLFQAPQMLDVHARLIRHLEQTAGLDRELEFLPDEDTFSQRRSDGEGLTAPELAVVMAYCKIHLYKELLDSDLPEDDDLSRDLERYFPDPLPDRYDDEMQTHRLRREIIATTVANQLVDRAGTTFTFRLNEETGASAPLLARAYTVAREVFDMTSFWHAVEELDNHVEAQIQLKMLIEGRRLVERASRWLVRAHPRSIDVAELIERFSDGAQCLADALPNMLGQDEQERLQRRVDSLTEADVPEELALRAASMPALLATFDIVEVADATGRELETVMSTFFTLGERVRLDWLRDRVIELPREDRWQALARAALRDELVSLYRSLTETVLKDAGDGEGEEAGEKAVEDWIEDVREPLERCLGILEDIRSARVYDTNALSVALRELRSLATSSRSAAAG